MQPAMTRAAPVYDRLDGIQMLRAVAILLVLAYHTSFFATIFSAIGYGITMPLYLGVELFFVISGFVVTRSLVHSNFSLLKFIVRRVFRLYPPIFFFLLLSAVQLIAVANSTISDGMKGLFGSSIATFFDQALAILTGTFINMSGGIIWPNGVLWSLSVEFQFYALMAVAVAVIGSLQLKIKPSLLVFVVASMMLCTTVFFRLANYGLPSGAPNLAYVLNWKFDFLIAGVVLFLAMEFKFIPSPSKTRVWHVALALVAVLVALSLARSPLEPPRYRNDLEGLPMLVALFGCIFMVWAGTSARVTDDVPGVIRRLMIAIGDRSYTLYLLHYPCMALIWLALYYFAYPLVGDPALRNVYSLVQILALIVLCGVLTEICYRYVEKPAIRAGSRFLNYCQSVWELAVRRSEECPRDA